jgi:hypothetical protein
MKRRPPGSNWGDYGAGDRVGRVNELTSERVGLRGHVGSPVTPIATV